MTAVLLSLLRFYRWIALGFVSIVLLVTVAGDIWLSRSDEVAYSLWVTIAANGTKYWVSVVAVMAVSMHLRPLVAAGLTRRAFLRGTAAFLLAAAVGFSLLVVAGHGVEQAVVRPAATYPVLTGTGAVTEFAHVLVTTLAFTAAGLAIAAGYYRFGPRRGFLLMIPAVVPVLLAEGLLGFGPYGATVARVLPYGLGLAVTLAGAALVAVLGERELRDTPIRPAT